MHISPIKWSCFINHLLMIFSNDVGDEIWLLIGEMEILNATILDEWEHLGCPQVFLTHRLNIKVRLNV